MNKEFFERKLRELEDSKLIDLLRIKDNANQDLIQLATEEARRRNLKIEPADFQNITSNPQFHPDVEDSNKLLKWNWGAFLLAPFWILANKLSVGWFLLLFVSLVNIVALFYLGFNGNRLAYPKSNINSVDDFLDLQKEWNTWGVRFFWILFVFSIVKLCVEIIRD